MTQVQIEAKRDTAAVLPRASAAGRSRAAGDVATDAAGAYDAELVARCRRGDRTAWTALVQRYQRLVYSVGRRCGLDEHGAADVFQTVFARLIEHMGSIGQPHRLQAWIVTTAKREALLQRRRSQRHVSMTRADDGADDDGGEWDVADESPIAEEALEELQQLNRLRVAMDRLDERSRTLIAMLFRDEDDRLPYDEIARRLDLPIGSIGPTRARCLEKLRRLLAEG
jgi:RNA polymerase sigma factor (sigma-70 family)